MLKEMLQELECIYSKNNYNGIGNSYCVRKGMYPVLISAPHSVRQVRDGKSKVQDLFTGSIAEYLAYENNVWSITKTCNCNDDANYDVESSYKDEISKLIEQNGIKVIIDLHGLSKDKDTDVDICIDNGSNLCEHDYLLDFLQEIFVNNQILYGTDEYYRANGDGCISKYFSKKYNVPCIELEINETHRNFYEHIENVEKIINCLTAFIRKSIYHLSCTGWNEELQIDEEYRGAVRLLTLSAQDRCKWYKIMRFDNMQIAEIEEGISRKIDYTIYTSKRFSYLQMQQIKEGLLAGIDVRCYTNESLSHITMKFIKEALIKRMNDSLKDGLKPYLLLHGYSEEQVKEVLQGIDENIDFTQYLRREYSAQQMRKMRETFNTYNVFKRGNCDG